MKRGSTGLLIGLFFLTSVCVQAQDSTRLSILFTGDIMQHDSQIQGAWNHDEGAYDYAACFQYVKPYLEAADLTIGNLELTFGGAPYTGYPQFSAPDQLATTLKDVGYDVLVNANNHALDRGRHGVERTIHVLDSVDMLHTGTFVDTVNRLNDYPLYLTRKGIRIALLNYTYGTNGIPTPRPVVVNRIDTTSIGADIAKALADSVDVVIAFLHWGIEYERLPNDYQRRIAAYCIRHGVKLVIGSHPHVIQPVEWDKDKDVLVAWSLGNFVSGQRKEFTDGGLMLRVDLQRDTITHKVRIDSVGYLLEWVYRTRNANQDYYILPAPVTERDTSNLVADEYGRQEEALFFSDSRSWLSTHNKDVSECDYHYDYEVVASDSLCNNATDVTAATVSSPCLLGVFESELKADRYLREAGEPEGTKVVLQREAP